MKNKRKLVLSVFKIKSPIGLAMLDLISNALASTLILFIILSSMQARPIPPEAIWGRLVIRYEIKKTYLTPDISIWVKQPDQNRLFDSDIENIETDFSPSLVGKLPGIPETAIVYTDTKDNSYFVREVTINNPHEGPWEAGILYADHSNFTTQEYRAGAVLSIKAYLVLHSSNEKLSIDINALAVKYPTESNSRFQFYVKDNKN